MTTPTRLHDCDHCRHWQIDPDEISEAARVRRFLVGLGGLLHETRRVRGISRREVGRQTGISYSTISRIEAKGTYDLAVALKLADWIENPPPVAEETDQP